MNNGAHRKDLITSHFKPVDADVHKLNVLIEHRKMLVNDKERARIDEEIRIRTQKEIAQQIVEDKARRAAAKSARNGPDKRSIEEIIRDNIAIITGVEAEDTYQPKKAKTWTERPDGWKVVAEYAIEHGDNKTLKDFPEFFRDANLGAAIMRLRRWKLNNLKKTEPRKQRPPAYGDQVEKELLEGFDQRRLIGLPVDSFSLRNILIPLLEKHGMIGLLKENGGSCTFQQSWANRFCRRNEISTRLCTTKMRELPADFENKKAEYLRIGTILLARYNIPPELVVGNDETAALLVNRAKRSFDRSGNKRVRVIGLGSDKAQITITLAITESGEVLHEQCIWAGKTTNCHPPSAAKPPGVLWSHTKSHWQDEQTYLDVFQHIFIPYRLRTIARLNLNDDQKMLVKLDLHYSHKTEALKRLCDENHIVLLYVPAKCTDILQECDVVLNGPFKAALKREFRDYLHERLAAHLAAGEAPNTFNPKLTYGQLKPQMPAWIQKAVATLKTDEMKATIAKSFKDDGLFGLMRDPAQILIVREQIDRDENIPAIPEGEEIDAVHVDDLIVVDEVDPLEDMMFALDMDGDNNDDVDDTGDVDDESD